jgi:formate/nitrite transporter
MNQPDSRQNGIRFDALLPPEMALKAEEIGVKKSQLDFWSTLALAVLAGAFIALGAVFATVTTAGSTLPFGVTRLLGGVVFSLGLILVVVGGAELFTGNNLIVMAWVAGKVSLAQLLRNWGIVYAGNFLGAFSVAVMIYVSKQYTFGGGAVGENALAIAAAKLNLGFLQALVLGILCNILVCLAVWMSFSARTTTDRILAVIPPIAAFVAMGFEHSIANMYFIPVALLIRLDAAFVSSASTPDLANFNCWTCITSNLVPVTIGNIIGGGVFVALVYWFIFQRKQGSEG